MATIDEASQTRPNWVTTAWAMHDSPRQDEPGLNATKIVAAAIELADDEGIAGLSIRKLGGRLGAGTMAAYRHVESREDLVILMVDSALGTPPVSILDTDDWRERVRRWAGAISARYARHPWLVDAPIAGFIATPNRALWLEYILQSLRPTGLGLRQMLDVALLIDGHARNVAALTRAVDAQDDAQDVTAPWLASLLTQERFPMLAQVLSLGELDEDSARDLEFGLGRIIDGIGSLAAEVDQR